MNDIITHSLRQTGALILFLGASLFYSSAQAEDNEIIISAYVSVECAANLQVNFTQISPKVFRIGSLNQFCNSNYEMNFTYAGTANGAEFRIGDKAVLVQTGQTQIESLASPVNGNADIYIANLDAAIAKSIASSLYISMTPLGI